MRPLVLMLALVAVAPARAARTDGQIDRWMERAAGHVQSGQTRRARVLIRRVHRRAPTDPRPVMLAADLMLADGRNALDDATWVVENAVGLEPRDDVERRRVSRAVAWAQALLGDHERAVHDMPAGLQDREGADDLRRLAAMLVERDALRWAQRALERALRSMPQDRSLKRDLAAVHLARGRADLAIRLQLDLLQQDPEDRVTRRDLAGSLLAAGRGDEALRTYQELARDGDDGARLDLAEAALELGRGRIASRAARRAAPSTRRWTVLGLALLALGERDDAQAALRRAPDDPRARQALRVLESSGSGASPEGSAPNP